MILCQYDINTHIVLQNINVEWTNKCYINIYQYCINTLTYTHINLILKIYQCSINTALMQHQYKLILHLYYINITPTLHQQVNIALMLHKQINTYNTNVVSTLYLQCTYQQSTLQQCYINRSTQHQCYTNIVSILHQYYIDIHSKYICITLTDQCNINVVLTLHLYCINIISMPVNITSMYQHYH